MKNEYLVTEDGKVLYIVTMDKNRRPITILSIEFLPLFL